MLLLHNASSGQRHGRVYDELPNTDVSEYAGPITYLTSRLLKSSSALAAAPTDSLERSPEPPEVEVVIEVPRGSFLKRGSTGRIDFISPLPCPFNYGSVPNYLGLEGDLLDALVLGPRLRLGARLRVKAWGAVTMTDRGLSDDKLVCSPDPLTSSERRKVLRFLCFYAKCKGLLNRWRRRPGRNACEGWCTAAQALARAEPLKDPWMGPRVGF